MAGSSTAELRLRPTRPDDLDFVVAAAADPDNAPYLAPSPSVEEGLMRDALFSGGEFQSLILMSILRPEWSP
jgi:RimJ/RimL family protein N-acetyltransferase